jgi:hypothetical protein
MGKILDAEFRKTLYKGLVDAGYEKQEAQAIVGKKYHGALKEDLMRELKILVAAVENETYDVSLNEEAVKKINEALEELKKVKGIIS